jgi:hypothetical protein
MKKTIFLTLCFLLSAFSNMLNSQGIADPPILVQAMVVHDIDGSRNIVPLEGTSVAEVIMHTTAGAITVEIPEATRSGVRSVVFAMVDISTSIDEIEATDTPQRKVEKILHEGNVYIHIQMPDGTDEWYDLSGRPVVLPMR